MDNVSFIDMFDWELENREHENKLLRGFVVSERLPAKIVVKIKFDTDDNQVNKRAFCGTSKEESES
jgi:hypothetical protein